MGAVRPHTRRVRILNTDPKTLYSLQILSKKYQNNQFWFEYTGEDIKTRISGLKVHPQDNSEALSTALVRRTRYLRGCERTSSNGIPGIHFGCQRRQYSSSYHCTEKIFLFLCPCFLQKFSMTTLRFLDVSSFRFHNYSLTCLNILRIDFISKHTLNSMFFILVLTGNGIINIHRRFTYLTIFFSILRIDLNSEHCWTEYFFF